MSMSHEWTTPEHALAYLERADRIPHRTEGEATLLDEVPKDAARSLDLGSGDGRLLSLLLLACPRWQYRGHHCPRSPSYPWPRSS
jgi:hypothetical protein